MPYFMGMGEAIPIIADAMIKLRLYCDCIASAAILTYNFNQYTMVK